MKTAAVQEGENAAARTVTRDAMGLCAVVTHPDGVVVRDYREEPAQGLTVAALVSILRANPKAALEAVGEAKIAGPRSWDADPLSGTARFSCRCEWNGRMVGDMRLQPSPLRAGNCWVSQADGQQRIVRTEPGPVEVAKALDEDLRAAGWILVDG